VPNPVPPAAPRARWRLSPPPSPALDALGDPLLARALAVRGVTELDGAAAFLGRTVGDDNPFRLMDMDRAVTRLRRAISGGERIAVYGDYDADGVTGTALLTTALRALGGDVLPHLPHRERDGYGVHTAALDRLAKHGVRLVVTVDCGVRAAEPLLHARALGLDVIVTDHHALPDALPAAVAVVNPRRADDGYGFHEFAGVGLAYKLAQALLRVAARTSARPAALHETDLLDLAAIGTVADVVPLVGENRMLVQGGLERIRAGARPGVAALCEAGGFEAATMTARGIAFGLGPRLNAAGRMGDATMALTLLLSDEDGEARRLAAQLEHMNRERRAATDVALEAAHADLAGRTDAPFLAWASPDVGLGVIGLVAGQLAQAHYRPAAVFRIEGDTARASLRSITEFNVVEALDRIAPLLERHGGHARAGGLTVRMDRLDEVVDALTRLADDALRGADLRPVLDIDAELPLTAVNDDLYRRLQALEPFGEANPSPLILSRDVTVASKRIVGERHLKLIVPTARGSMEAMAFGHGDRLAGVGDRIDVVYGVRERVWRGERSLELDVQDFAAAGTARVQVDGHAPTDGGRVGDRIAGMGAPDVVAASI